MESQAITITDTHLYETFREALGKDKAEKTVSAIKNTVRSEMENQTQALVTREQLAELKLQLSALELRLIDRVQKSQLQTIFWIVSIGVLQFIASCLLKG